MPDTLTVSPLVPAGLSVSGLSPTGAPSLFGAGSLFGSGFLFNPTGLVLSGLVASPETLAGLSASSETLAGVTADSTLFPSDDGDLYPSDDGDLYPGDGPALGVL